jgi:two-component system invasion response regulator UvrY
MAGVFVQHSGLPLEAAGTRAATTSPHRRRGLGDPIRVGLVDDHPIVREALRSYLREHEGIVVAGEANCGRTAMALVRETPLDVLVLDLDMPNSSGIEAIRSIRARAPEVAVVVYSGFPPQQYAVPLMRSGASAYLSKSCSPREVVAAIRKVADGGTYITPEVADLLATQLAPVRGTAPHEGLTPRELQVFLKLAQGRRPGEVARELCLSAKTVSSHRAMVLRKLEARSNSDLTYYALKHGLLG